MTRLPAAALALSTAAAAAPQAAAVPATPEPGALAGLIHMGAGLAIVLAMLAAAAWLVRRFGVPRGRGATSLKVVASTAVGSRERVVVLEIADTWLVVGVAPGSVNALHQMPRVAGPDGEPVAPAVPPFATWLKRTMDRRNGE